MRRKALGPPQGIFPCIAGAMHYATPFAKGLTQRCLKGRLNILALRVRRTTQQCAAYRRLQPKASEARSARKPRRKNRSICAICEDFCVRRLTTQSDAYHAFGVSAFPGLRLHLSPVRSCNLTVPKQGIPLHSLRLHMCSLFQEEPG